MRIKSLVSVALTLSILASFSVVHAAEYETQIKECLKVKCMGEPTGCTPTEASIDKYICPEWTMNVQDVAYQVILDLEFQKVDKDVKTRLTELSTPTYKGKNPVEIWDTISKWFDIVGTKDDFYARYTNVCNGLVVMKASLELPYLYTYWDIKNVIAWNNDCTKLAFRKLLAYRDAAWLISERNIVQNYKSDKKVFLDTVKDKYTDLLMKFTIYLWQLARITDKWNVKTGKTQP